MRTSDWSPDVCSSDLAIRRLQSTKYQSRWLLVPARASSSVLLTGNRRRFSNGFKAKADRWMAGGIFAGRRNDIRSEEHTSELQSLMRISYAVFCLKKKKTQTY